MNYILFDPPITRDNLLPLTYTRPVSEIRIGILKIHEKWEKTLQSSISWFTQPYLSGKFPVEYGDTNLLINGSVLPDIELVEKIHSLTLGQALYAEKKLIAIKNSGFVP